MKTRTFVGRVEVTEIICGTTSAPNLCMIYANGKLKAYKTEDEIANELANTYGNKVKQNITYNRRLLSTRKIELGQYISELRVFSIPIHERKSLEALVKKVGVQQ